MKKLLFVMLAIFFASQVWANNALVIVKNGNFPCNGFTQSNSCPLPAALAVPQPTITTNSATVTWTDDLLAEEYVIQWKKATVSWEDGSVLSAAVLTGLQSFMLTPLQPSTLYNVRIRAVCNYGIDSSDWVSAEFYTLCGNISVDTEAWIESFESLTAANTLPPCWSASNFGDKVKTQIENYQTPISSRFAHTGHSALYFNINCNDSVKTPTFALTEDVAYKFSFWYHTDGLTGWLNLSANVFDENGVFVGTVGTPLSNITNTNYLKYQGTFTPTTSGNYYFSIKCVSNWNVYFLTIDDISLKVNPACPDVDYFTATMHSPTEAALNWDLSSDIGNNGWVIAYSNEIPFDPETANHTTVTSADEFPYILSGLEDDTTYNFAVQTNCGGEWTTPIAIAFPSLNNIKTVPYQQDFENSANVGEWTFSNDDINGWYFGTATSYPSGGHSLYVSNNGGLYNNYSNTAGGTAFITASIIVDFGSYLSYKISFDWHCKGETSYDLFRVYAVPVNYPLTNSFPSGAGVHQIGGNFYNKADWEYFEELLSTDDYANQQYKIVFMFSYDYATISNPAPAIDNLIINGSDCGMIYNITASSITTSSANINFNDTYSEQDVWEYVYGVAGTILDPDLEIPAAALDNPIIPLSGLTENTSYNVWIRSSCSSPTSTPEWSQMYTFRTRSSSGLIPYSCTFESDDPEATTWQNVTASGSNSWSVGYPVYHDGTTSNSGTPFGNGTQAAYITGNTSAGSGSVQNNYYYRVIDFGTTPIDVNLSFDYKSKGYCAGTNCSINTSLYVWLVDESTSVNPSGLPIGNALSVFRTGDNDWHTYSTQLFNQSGTKKLVFGFAKTTTSMSSFLNPAVDNIIIEEVECPTPTEVTAETSPLDEHDVTLSWDDHGGTSWRVYYKQVNAPNYIFVNATTNPTTLSGLTLSTAYNIYIVTDCGSDGLSGQSETIVYYTPCASGGFSVPYTQNFEDYTATTHNTDGFLPSCWAATGTYAVTPHITGGGSFHYPHSVPNVLTFSASGGTNSYAILPQFNNPIEDLTLSFWYMQEDANRGILEVGYITVDDQTDMSTYTALANVPPSASLAQFTYDFPTATVDLTNATYIVLHWSLSYPVSYVIGVDDISVTLSNTCPTPKNVLVSPITGNSATVSWASNASEWQVAWKTTAGTNWNYATTEYNTYTIPALTATTNYDVKVRTICTADSSAWSSTAQFTTTAAAACVAPVITNATSATPTTATITWTSGSSATAWLVEYGTGGNYSNTVHATTAQSHTLNSLQPNTTYNVRMRAICGVGDTSSYSNVVTFITPQTPCLAPTIINTTSTDTSITIIWQGNNNETEWLVAWRSTNPQTAGSAYIPEPPVFTIYGLRPNTTYQICVRAICEEGVMSDSVCTTVSTLPVGIKDIILANGLQLYPNPTTGELQIINYELSEGDKVEIYNMLGQKQQFSVLNIQRSTIDVSHLSAGMYMMKIGGYVGKFVKR